LSCCLLRSLLPLIIATLGANQLSAQGSLTPPGSPAPVMKTLDQIEPRTPISSLPYTISESGSYYLTGPLQSASSGIMIEADDVTLDLMGFTIRGSRSPSALGVSIDGTPGSPVQRVVVKNGGVEEFAHGILVDNAVHCRIEDIIVYHNRFAGFLINAYNGLTESIVVERCKATENDSSGIQLSAVGGQITNVIIRDCDSTNNDLSGILIGLAPNGIISGNEISRCLVAENDEFGIRLYSNEGSINGNRIEDCNVLRNGSGGSSYDGILLEASAGGTVAGTVIRNCVVEGNAGEGIYLYGSGGDCSGNQVIDNTVRGNGNYGIRLNAANGNRIDSNHVVDQVGTTTYGIRTSGSRNVVIRNSAAGHTYNFSTISGNLYGPYIKDTGNLDTASGGNNPWANFDFDD
jgi:parallel beta-helix repeat protein